MQAKRLVLSQLSQGVTPCIFDNLNVLFWILVIILQILIWIFFNFTCYIVKLSNRSHELDNSFSRIAIRSLELDNPFSRIAIRSLKLDKSFSRIAIRSLE